MKWSRVIILLVALTMPAAASVIFVDSRAGGADDGTSWANAYTDLQDALDVAPSGAEIWVAGGPYVPNRDPSGEPNDRFDTFTIRGPGVKVFGGFLGIETDRVQRNAFQHQTVLAGLADKYRVVTIDASFGADAGTVFDGFIVTGGLADGDGKIGEDSGAGMRIDGVDAVIANCWFVANHASSLGGALKIVANNVTIVNCQFTDNSAGFLGFEGEGGAIWSYGGTRLVNCLLHTNFAGIDGVGHAAYVYSEIEGNPAQMINCTVTNNGPFVPTGTGAMAVDGVLVVRNSILWGNRTADGQPIAWDEGDLVFVDFSDIEGGFAGSGNISVDPLFASAFVESFRLIKASPCTDVGDFDPLPLDDADLDQDGDRAEILPLDLELTQRVDGVGPNLGCFETFDCQANNIGDALEFASGTALDCNANAIPDDCDIRDCDGDPACGDCNQNARPDGCESTEDCNGNGQSDLCDIATNPSLDCDADGRPDSCRPDFSDCNSDGIADFCQPELDLDGDDDGVPDCIDNCPGKANADQLDGNANGNGDACDSLLTVGPCPGSIESAPEGLDGAVVIFDLPQAQNGYGAVVVTATPASGSLFPIGTTTVVVRATDEGGGDVSCTFELAVLEPDDDTGLSGDCPPLYRMNTGVLRFFGLPIGCGPGCLIALPLTLAGLAGMKFHRRGLPRR